MSRYSIHPTEQDFQDWEKKQKEKRNTYWQRLRVAYKDYEENYCHGYYEPNFNTFRTVMEKKYGLRVNMVGDNIGNTYEVIDEAKHTLFLLKYGNR